MGAWGTGPYDNDTAADHLGGRLASLVADEVGRLLDEDANGEPPDLYTVRSAAWLIESLWVSSYTSPIDEVRLPLIDKTLHYLREYAAGTVQTDWIEAIQGDIERLEAVREFRTSAPGLLDRIREATS